MGTGSSVAVVMAICEDHFQLLLFSQGNKRQSHQLTMRNGEKGLEVISPKAISSWAAHGLDHTASFLTF